jgi:peptide deformylase
MIIKNNPDALRLKCQDVDPKEAGELISLLEQELLYSERIGFPGIGLAAPQLGIAKNVAIVRLGSNGHYNLNVNLINAKIVKGYDSKVFVDEGCLSFPGMSENTNRFQEIFVENSMTDHTSFVATGLMAVCIQHELDHLNGLLLPDNALPKITTYLNKNKVGVNDPCTCGSGKKFKKCCLRK